MSKDLFFSIVVPSHNEEKYIEFTLQHLENLEYPKELYEVIVVENGSTDSTYERAKGMTSKVIKVCTIPEAGVSKARNYGSTQASPDADWVLFLDADTFPDPPFLRSLANFLNAKSTFAYVIGTAELQPYPSTFVMKILYTCTNIGFRMSRAAYGGALFVKRSILDSVSFDEELAVGEDETFAKKVQSLGGFFFYSTRLVHTSTRRFQNGGWQRIPVWVGMWLFAMMIPRHAKFTASLQRRFKYKVIR